MSLDPERRRAMAVFYDFCRAVDDIVDNTVLANSEKTAQLQNWRDALEAIYAGGSAPDFALQLQAIVQKFEIPQAFMTAIIDGVAMDIEQSTFATFNELKLYCYRVASAVGLVCIRIFGCQHPQSQAYAEALGYALQLTNILRDIVEDYHEMQRVYLPQEELRQFGINPSDFEDPQQNPNCERLFRMCYYRCKHYFNQARRLLPESDRKNLKAALIMAAFYEAILEKIKANGFRITRQRVRLSKARKLHLLWKTLKNLKQPLPPLQKPGSIAVFGGGVAGITAALNAGLEGHTPHLYEAKAYVGGRAHSLTDAPTGLTLDNGQHIVMGCYTSFMQLVELLGIEAKFLRQDSMVVPYLSPGNRWSRLKAEKLPAPFHLLCGLFTFDELSTSDRMAIVRMGAVLRLGSPPPDDETVAHWLERNRQTPGAIRALWEPFCVAALNEPISTASACLLYQTLQRSLFGSPQDATILLSKVGLSELFFPEVQLFLRSIGGELHIKSQVKHIQFSKARVESVETAKGSKIQADYYISALPWHSIAPLLPEAHTLREQIAKIPSSAIISIHLLCDRPVFTAESSFVGLLDSPIHWVFDRTATLPESHRDKHLYAVVISAANAWLDKTSSEIITALVAELKRFFPNAANLKIERQLVYKSKNATFAARPETEPKRPGIKTPWRNFFLAGDWTATKIPATLEGAAQSGFAAVQSVDYNF